MTLSATQHQALHALKDKLPHIVRIVHLLVYGSVARSESDEESDLDVLVLTERPLSRFKRHEITDAVFEINLHYRTNISTLVVDRHSWETGPISVLPIHAEIQKDGMPL